MTENDRWMRLYSIVLGLVVCSPLVMIGTRVVQVGQEVKLGYPASTGIYRHALGRRLDDMSWWVHLSAAIACVIIYSTLYRIRKSHLDRWAELRIAPNWLWTSWASVLTIFYLTRVYFQDTGNAFFYEFSIERSTSLKIDPIMQALQSWEGWHNILMTWVASLFFPAAWGLLAFAKRSKDCDAAGRLAAVACLNAGIAPATMLWLFQFYRALYISGLLGEEAKLFKKLGWAMGGAAMSIQILPLFVLSVFGLFVYRLSSRYCLGFGNIIEVGIDLVEERASRISNPFVKYLSPGFIFLKYIDRFAIGLWWVRKPDCPCKNDPAEKQEVFTPPLAGT